MPFLSRLRRPGTRKSGCGRADGRPLLVFTRSLRWELPRVDLSFAVRCQSRRRLSLQTPDLIGTAVFIFVEGILVWTLIKFRKRPGQAEPQHVHGNTTLEIAWTVIPLIILAFIAVPTIRVIFKTQAAARSDALQVEVIGHQWWWEFRYPQYQVTTANELYLPLGRTVNFTLKSQDVIHSFWIPALNGKRDVIPNRTNYLWFSPDSAGASAWNGACAEFCGTSHANMRFKTFTVAPADFESWAKHQSEAAVMPPGMAAPAAPVPAAVTPGATPAQTAAKTPAPAQAAAKTVGDLGSGGRRCDGDPRGFISFPREQMAPNTIPQTPIPNGLKFDDSVLGKGDAANGAKLMAGAGACLACHMIKGNPMMVGVVGPNLTHVATRTSIAGGIFPNDPQHLARWIKNAREMKPGVIMPTMGAAEFDPVFKNTVKPGLTDQQIADIVAYLQTLK